MTKTYFASVEIRRWDYPEGGDTYQKNFIVEKVCSEQEAESKINAEVESWGSEYSTTYTVNWIEFAHTI